MEAVAAALGLRVVERCAGGEFGATVVTDAGGHRRILKVFDPDREPALHTAAGLAERLRVDRHYPAPRYLDVGSAAGAAYTLQEELPGRVPDVLRVAHAERQLELAELHAGQAPDADPEAWRRDLTAMLDGSSPWPSHEVLRRRGGRPAALADEVAEVAGVAASARLPGNDVVHYDFHHRNLLADGDRVTGIFDWDGARAGDAAFDVVTLFFWTRAAVGQAEPPAAAAVARRVDALDPVAVAVYTAQLALQFVEFCVRVHPGPVEDWGLDAVERVLAPRWRAIRAAR